MPQTIEEFREDALQAHNKYREVHGAPKLTLNTELCDVAQKWADELASTGRMRHNDTPYGENLGIKWTYNSAHVDGAEATEMWYKEEAKYSYSPGGYSSEAGQFTQLVWKATKEMGIGVAMNSSGMNFVVANYRPAGNVYGMFKDNVLNKTD